MSAFRAARLLELARIANILECDDLTQREAHEWAEWARRFAVEMRAYEGNL